MSRRLESYLEDLRSRLARHFEPSRLDEVVAEMRSHLTLSARDAHRELELEPDDAMRSALRALGPVETVAEDLVRQHRGGTSKSAWQVLRTPIVLYVLAFGILPVFTILSGFTTLQPWTVWGKSLTYLPTLVLITFGWAVWKSQRWLLKPMCAAIAGMFVFFALLSYVPAYQRAVDKAVGVTPNWQATRLKEIEAEIRMTELGAKGYLDSPEKFTHSGNTYLYPDQVENAFAMPAPFLPFTILERRQSFLTLRQDTWDPKKANLWTQNGAAVRANLVEERATMLEGKVRRPGFMFPFPYAMYMFGSQAAMLGLVNLGVLATSNRRRRRRARNDPHLA